MPSKRGTLPPDLRTAARGPIAKKRLAEVLESIGTAPNEIRLWLGERWPWTTGTDAALATRRPRWAVFAIDVASARRYASSSADADAAVREMNRDLDPWPAVSRQVIPASGPTEASAPAEVAELAEAPPPSKPK